VNWLTGLSFSSIPFLQYSFFLLFIISFLILICLCLALAIERCYFSLNVIPLICV